MATQKSKRPTGIRKGTDREPPEKKNYSVSLTQSIVSLAKLRESNFSALVERLLIRWLQEPDVRDGSERGSTIRTDGR